MQDRFTQDGVVYETLPNGNVRVVGYAEAAPQPQGQVFTLPEDPAAAARQAASDSRANAADRRAQEESDRKAREWAATHNPDGSPKPTASKNGSAELTAATRASAINAFTATRQLDNLITDIEKRFEAGPGSTKGIWGVQDWLPTPSNRQFDAAGNAVRGAAITALGFTSGQTNTPREVEQNIGPYIPAAGDYDEVITDKIARLKELRDRARVQAVTVLGGIPDASGKITPLSQLPQQDRDKLFPPGTLQPFDPGAAGAPPAPPVDGNRVRMGDFGGPQGIAFGGDAAPITGKRFTPGQERQVLAAIRAGDLGQTLALQQRFSGNPPDDAAIQSASAAIEAVRRDPRTKVEIGYGGIDAAAQAAADRERYGDNLGPALRERQAAPIDSAIRSAANAATFNLADPLVAALSTPFSGQGYGENLQRERAFTEAGQRVNPSYAIGGAIGGGALTAGLGELALAKAAGTGTGFLPTVLRSPVTADASFGALSAGANGDNPITGMFAGAGGGVLGRTAARPISAAARGVEGLGRRVLGATPSPLAPNAAQKAVIGAADRVGQPTIDSFLEEAANMDVPAALVDIAPQFRSLGGAVVRRSPQAAQIAEGALLPRARGQIDRLGSAMDTAFGPGANIPQRSADLVKKARQDAGPLYDRAFSNPGVSSVDLSDLSSRPGFKAALQRAQSLAAEEGVDPTSLGFQLNDAGEVVLERVPSFRTLDYVKRGLDDEIGANRNAFGNVEWNDQLRAVEGTRSALVKRMDAVNDDYRAARAAYAGPAGEREAFNQGVESINLRPDQLRFNTATMPANKLDQYRLGARSALGDRAETVRFSSNPWEGVAGSPAAQERLGTLWPEGTPDFLKKYGMEQQLAKTNNGILGNSMTAERQIADQAFAGSSLPALALDAGMMAAGQLPTATIGRKLGGQFLGDSLKLGVGKRAVQKADELAPILFNTNPRATAATLSELVNSAQAYKDFVSRYNRTVGRVGGMFGAGFAVPGVGTQ